MEIRNTKMRKKIDLNNNNHIYYNYNKNNDSI